MLEVLALAVIFGGVIGAIAQIAGAWATGPALDPRGPRPAAMKALVAVTLAVMLAGCGITTPHQRAGQPSPTFAPDAYTVATPRSDAYHAACAKKGGHVLGQDCVTQGAGGVHTVPIFEDDVERERAR